MVRHGDRHTFLIKSLCILTKSFCPRQKTKYVVKDKMWYWHLMSPLNILNHPLIANLYLYAGLTPIKCFRLKHCILFFFHQQSCVTGGRKMPNLLLKDMEKTQVFLLVRASQMAHRVCITSSVVQVHLKQFHSYLSFSIVNCFHINNRNSLQLLPTACSLGQW